MESAERYDDRLDALAIAHGFSRLPGEDDHRFEIRVLAGAAAAARAFSAREKPVDQSRLEEDLLIERVKAKVLERYPEGK